MWERVKLMSFHDVITDVEKGLYPVDLNQGELTVPGLKAGVLYVVCVRSLNTRGIVGSFGNPVQSRTSAGK